jgi:hypothetical protein
MLFTVKISRGILLVSLGLLFSPYSLLAQFSKLDDAGAQIAKELKHEKNNKIAVADFRSPDGSANSQGHYFAWYLSGSIQESRKKLKVLDHLAFDSNLLKSRNSAATTVFVEFLRNLGASTGADVIIIGTVERKGSEYLFQITPTRVANGTSLFSKSFSMNVSDFLESLLLPFPAEGSEPVLHAGVNGIGLPICVRCPDPSYTDLARQSKIQGTDTFEVIITVDGVVQQLRPTKLLGYGLDEEGYNTIKKWKFKAATRKDGTPVTVLVPVEVTFRLR